MSYTVKVFYETGDSYGGMDTEDCIEMSWNSKELAQQAMREIVEHEEYAQDMYAEGDEEEFSAKPWWCDEYSGFVLKLETDSGKRQKVTVPWTGYFESLISAKVISTEDDKDEILVRGWQE